MIPYPGQQLNQSEQLLRFQVLPDIAQQTH